MVTDLFKYVDFLDFSDEYLIFGEVTMLRDFGPISAGTTFSSVTVHTNERQCIEFYDGDDGILSYEVGYLLLPTSRWLNREQIEERRLRSNLVMELDPPAESQIAPGFVERSEYRVFPSNGDAGGQ